MGNKVFDIKEYARTARAAVAEGIVMLKNQGNVLPFRQGEKIALFGRGQFNYYKSGTGSGGLVNTSYVTGIREALEGSGFVLNEKVKQVYEEWLKDNPFDVGKGWAAEPWFQKEMPLTEELVREARKTSDTAVIIIARTAGEDQDNKAEAGSYLLTGDEEDILRVVCDTFERTVVLLNVGNIIDMKWVERYQPSAVLYVWQGGQEGGNGVLDVLSGTVSPSGKLTDTIALDIADYPSTDNHGGKDRNVYQEDIYVGYRYFETFARDKVLYPFGFGLSYTTFSLDARMEDVKKDGASCCCGTAEAGINIRVTVTNTGTVPGKEVAQVYCQAPQGALGKPARSLCGFAKTKELAPGESQTLEIAVPWHVCASYDDSGASGHKSCWVLEAGEYVFHVGTDVRSASMAGSRKIEECVVVESLEEACAPVTAFDRMKPGVCGDGSFRVDYEAAPLRTQEPGKRREDRLSGISGAIEKGFSAAESSETPLVCTGDKGLRLADVEAGKASMGEFLAQLTDEDLCCIVRGEGMCSPKVTPGTAGAFGGVTKRLKG
ncbi:MAG: beta-glucosidase, partial [Lachnospiraceae bacterium]|nr:beta-glucosidase [Lachnospiraceae bacterium]